MMAPVAASGTTGRQGQDGAGRGKRYICSHRRQIATMATQMNPITAITQRVTKFSWVTGLICAVLILGAGAATAAVRFDAAERKVVLQGVTVSGVALDGLEFGAARQRLLDRFDKPLDREIAIEVSGVPHGSVTPRDLGVSTNVEDVYKKAVSLHGSLPMWKRIWYRITGMSIGHDLAVKTSFDQSKTKAFVTTLSRSVNRPPKDASVSLVGGSPKIASEVPGGHQRDSLLPAKECETGDDLRPSAGRKERLQKHPRDQGWREQAFSLHGGAACQDL
jgi:hypothetical protein